GVTPRSDAPAVGATRPGNRENALPQENSPESKIAIFVVGRRFRRLSDQSHRPKPFSFSLSIRGARLTSKLRGMNLMNRFSVRLKSAGVSACTVALGLLLCAILMHAAQAAPQSQ